MKNPVPLLYISFDRVPAAKGASTHIEANVRALGLHFGSVVLVTPGAADVSVRDFAPGVRQVVLGCPDEDMLGCVMTFRAKLKAFLTRQAFVVVHFRSPFEGYPLVRGAAGDALLVYEVNGLPSIELKYLHPRVGGDDTLLIKLRHQEQACLHAADRVLTVSETNRVHLRSRGCDDAILIRNGVDVEAFPYRDPQPRSDLVRVLYFGTLNPWQGIEVLLDALPIMSVASGATLTLAGPATRRRREELQRRAKRLGVESRLTFTGPLSREQLVSALHGHDACVVPLTSADRNIVQGCCPLKLLEALAAGCPVIASDLPVVRELVTAEHVVFVPPDDPISIALALLRVGEEAQVRARTGRRHVESMTWKASTDALIRVYEDMLASRVGRLARSTSGE